MSIKFLVAIVIGIIVIAVFVYLMLFYSKESSFECRLCSSRFAEWCQKCLIAGDNWDGHVYGFGWTTDVPKSDELEECLEACMDIKPEDSCNVLKGECEKHIYMPPTSTTT